MRRDRPRLGWRSWLALAALLPGAAAGLLFTGAAAATSRDASHWTLTAMLGLATVAQPLLLGWAVLRPLPSAPAPGEAFARSRAGLAGATLVGSVLVTLATLLYPVGGVLIASIPDLLARRDWAMAGLLLVSAPGLLIALPVLAWAWWRHIVGGWRRRRQPFAVVGEDGLWIDGRRCRWGAIAGAAVVSGRAGPFLRLRTGRQARGTPLFALAGPAEALLAAITARIEAAR